MVLDKDALNAQKVVRSAAFLCTARMLTSNMSFRSTSMIRTYCVVYFKTNGEKGGKTTNQIILTCRFISKTFQDNSGEFPSQSNAEISV